MAVELYHFWSSVCSVKARMALEQKGVAWESRYIDLFRFDQMTPEYLAINPDGRTADPEGVLKVLETGDFYVWTNLYMDDGGEFIPEKGTDFVGNVPDPMTFDGEPVIFPDVTLTLASGF